MCFGCVASILSEVFLKEGEDIRITLLIMVYNNEAFVERTLLSILENDTKFFDIIIVPYLF